MSTHASVIFPNSFPPKGPVFEVLIQNAHILFEEHSDPSLPVLSSHVSDTSTTSTLTYSSLDQGPEFSLSAELQAPSPLLGFPSSQTLMEDVETTEGEGAGGTKVVEVLSNNTPQDVNVVSPMPTSVAERRLQVRHLGEHPQPALTIPQSPPVSVLSITSDFTFSSATSLQTAMGPY